MSMEPKLQQCSTQEVETHISSTYFSEACSPRYRDRTYFYNMETNQWTSGPTMSMRRRYHTCDLVTHEDGTRDIVIVGGLNSAYTNTVEIIHLDSNSQTHRSGNNV